MALLTADCRPSSVGDIAPVAPDVQTRKASEMSVSSTHPGVVVGVDGSPSSTLAVRWAAREATMRKVPLTLVNVVSTPPANSSALAWTAAPLPAEARAWQEENARKIITDAINVVEGAAQGDPSPRSTVKCSSGRPHRPLSSCLTRHR